MMTILMIVAAAVAGAVVALKVIAPLTKTKVDDKALEVLEKADDVLKGALPKDKDSAAK